MTELEKLRAITSLATTLFQHTSLKIMPTWFCGIEDDGYTGECYHIGWQNDVVSANIELAQNDKDEYKFLIWVQQENKNEFDRWEYYPVKDFLKYPTNPILEEYAKYINNIFK
jgi:hypothetical protein